MMASKYGIMADSAGTISPHIPSSAAAQIDRSKLDLPPPFGPVNRNNDCTSTVLCTAPPSAMFNQYGNKPSIFISQFLSNDFPSYNNSQQSAFFDYESKRTASKRMI
jgi:hypothetical protein